MQLRAGRCVAKSLHAAVLLAMVQSNFKNFFGNSDNLDSKT